MPEVTVIIPVYNAESYIKQTIRSVLDQTFKDIELIVMNDGSTDGSEKVIKEIAQEDNRILYHYKANSGVSDTRNQAIAIAKGNYIAFLDADDVWKHDNLEKKLQTLKQSGRSWVFSDLELIDQDNNSIPSPYSNLHPDNILDRLLLWEADAIPGPCSNIVVKRELFGEDVKFDTRLSSPADRDICIQLACKAEPAYVDEKLWQYRQHPQSMTNSNMKVADEVIWFIDKLKKAPWFKKKKIRKRSLSNLYLMLSGICYKFVGQKGRAFRFFFRSFLYSPLNIWQKKFLPVFRSKK